MGNNKRAFDAPRGNLFLMDPADMTLIEDPAHPLYDERVKLPVNDGLVRSIAARGVLKPVLVRKEGDAAIVIDGRQRVKAAREVNKLAAAEGSDPIRVPCVVRRSDDKDASAIVVEANEHTQQDGIETKARKAQRLQERGLSTQEIAGAFGVSPATIGNWMKLLELNAKVRGYVVEGRMRMTDAVKLAAKPRDEQLAAADKLVDEAPTRKVRAERGEKGRRAPGPGSRLRRLAPHDGLLDARSRVLVRWLLGDATDGDLVAQHARLADVIR